NRLGSDGLLTSTLRISSEPDLRAGRASTGTDAVARRFALLVSRFDACVRRGEGPVRISIWLRTAVSSRARLLDLSRSCSNASRLAVETWTTLSFAASCSRRAV